MPEIYENSTLENIIMIILAVLIIIISVWSIYAFFRAIFLFIFSGGDDEKVKSAWSSIRYMIIWLTMTILILFLFPLVLDRMRIPNSDNFSATNIFAKAWDVLEWVFGLKDVIQESQELNQYEWNLYYKDDNIPVFYDQYDL